jgi:CubicO group peptidase (beta-lactamase class C family)
MKSSRRWVGVARVLSGVAAVLLVLVVVGALVAGIPQNAAGMAAKGICSAALVAGRPMTTLLADDVLPASPVLRLISIEVDHARQRVTGRFAGLFARTAVRLPDRGCVLDLPAAALPAPPPPVASDAPWPGGDTPIAIEQWSDAAAANRLKQVVDGAFTGAGDPQGVNARGVAVVQHGRLLALRLAPGFGPSTPLHGWSMTKTVNAMLAYKRAAESGLALETPVVDAFVPGRAPAWTAAWRADTRRDIKVSDLLYMRDGLANVEDYNPWGTVPEMLWGEPDAAAYAAASPAEAAPGTRWRYLSATANILSAVVRGRFAGDAEYWAYPAQALFGPIGARTAFMETDTAGTWVGSSYLWASVGDWARLGQLLLDDGRWGGHQVLPPGFLALAKTPAMRDGAGHGYGAQAWLLGDPVGGTCRGQGLPADIVAMSGHWGQVVAVVPSRSAVIVRLGWTFRRSQFDACRFIGEVLQALPR